MKNTKCIVVLGKSNTGKTTSLKLLISSLSKKYEDILHSSYSDIRVTNDVIEGFLINGYKVGIMTEGDMDLCVKYGLTFFKDYDLVIGASHLYGKTIEEYFNHYKNDELLFLIKPKSEIIYVKSDNDSFAKKLEELLMITLSSKGC